VRAYFSMFLGRGDFPASRRTDEAGCATQVDAGRWRSSPALKAPPPPPQLLGCAAPESDLAIWGDSGMASQREGGSLPAARAGLEPHPVFFWGGR